MFLQAYIKKHGLTRLDDAVPKKETAKAFELNSSETLRTTRMPGLDREGQVQKIDKLLEKIQTFGIPALSDNSKPMCQEFFHLVFYQAIEDNLRLVYD
jgi:hypothetical protein